MLCSSYSGFSGSIVGMFQLTYALPFLSRDGEYTIKQKLKGNSLECFNNMSPVHLLTQKHPSLTKNFKAKIKEIVAQVETRFGTSELINIKRKTLCGTIPNSIEMGLPEFGRRGRVIFGLW